jgi:hypothetical protein
LLCSEPLSFKTKDGQATKLLDVLNNPILEAQIEAATRCVAVQEDRARRAERELDRFTSYDPFLRGRCFTWRQVKDLFGEQLGHRLWLQAKEIPPGLMMSPGGPAVSIKVAACVY